MLFRISEGGGRQAHLDVEVQKVEGGAEEGAEVRDARDLPPGLYILKRKRVRKRETKCETDEKVSLGSSAYVLPEERIVLHILKKFIKFLRNSGYFNSL